MPADTAHRIPPRPQYIALRLPDGSHSGVCVDVQRLVLEVQRKGVKYYFDLAVMYNNNHWQVAQQVEHLPSDGGLRAVQVPPCQPNGDTAKEAAR